MEGSGSSYEVRAKNMQNSSQENGSTEESNIKWEGSKLDKTK